MYINVSSNHPQTIIKQLPKMINRRISDLSSTEEEYNNAKGFYENALKRSGHNFKLTFEQPTETKHPTRKRKRKILWYNPPFSRNVQTNIGKKFFALANKTLRKTPQVPQSPKPQNGKTQLLLYAQYRDDHQEQEHGNAE